ncbi:MAG TPA: hypothetical protein VGS07_31775 [Thermoanaerobaculia bacterium]|jgi:hypothetical protein|nr:hypothetical protein [Thermoanaerobaculia bacterium]
MKTRNLALASAFLLVALALSAFAADSPKGASIQILKPADHADLDSDEAYPLDYQVVLGSGDDHFHVWVDADRSPGIHDLKGTYMLPKMTPGKHVITLKLVDKGHVPTGPQKPITVNVVSVK